MAWELDAGRVWRICIYDKRVRAAIISYLIASVSTVILEPFFPLDLISYLIMLVPSCILSSGYSQYKVSDLVKLFHTLPITASLSTLRKLHFSVSYRGRA